MTIAPFSIATSDDVLEDLRRRLEMTRWLMQKLLTTGRKAFRWPTCSAFMTTG